MAGGPRATMPLMTEFAYGYGKLDRFDLTRTSRFFAARLQLTL